MRRHRGLGLTVMVVSATCFNIIGWFLSASSRQWPSKLVLVTASSGRHCQGVRRRMIRQHAGPDSVGRVLDSEELLELMQRPGAADDIKEIAQKLLSDPTRRQKFNNTLVKLGGVLGSAGVESEGEIDPLAKILADPMLLKGLQDPSTSKDILADLNRSALFEEMRIMGSVVIEQVQIKNLKAGELVEITGLESQPQLNGVVGTLVEATDTEADSFTGRRVVELQNGQRLALKLDNLVFPRYNVGAAVTLETKFGGEETGLEGRAAVVSELTEEERTLGWGRYSGRVVVDVLPLVVGGPVLQRLLMWPEHLRPRQFVSGDAVQLAELSSDSQLNGAACTVVTATAEERANQSPGQVVVVVDADGSRLLVREQNLRLLALTPPTLLGIG